MAEDRQSRLKAIAARKAKKLQEQKNQENEGEQADPDTTIKSKSIQFRNYTPIDSSLETSHNEKSIDEDQDMGETDHVDESLDNENAQNNVAKKRRFEEPVSNVMDSSDLDLESALLQAKLEQKNQLTKNSQTSSASNPKQPSLLNSVMSTKKVNWDLKQDIQKKLDRLEKRTQTAIVHILKERLEREASEEVDDDDNELD